MISALRLLTINTGKCDGPYRARLRWLVEEVKRLQPDIIACQEAFQDESRHLDTAGTLARELGFALAWAPARFKERMCEGEATLGWSGMALLSRKPWSFSEALQLPSDPADGDRVAQVGIVDGGDGQLVVANVHLSHLKGADELRREQLDVVLAHPSLRELVGPVLICGDFNSTSDGAVLAPLLAGPDGPSLHDAFCDGGGSPEIGSLSPREDGSMPGRRIDFILSLAPDEDHQPYFTSSSIVLNRRDPESGSFPSDHFGVATTLILMPDGLRRRKERAELGR